MFALNQGEVCTCPSRVWCRRRSTTGSWKAPSCARAVKQGHPLDPSTMIGAQASNDQLEKILAYIDIGRQEGAEVLAGGGRARPRRRARRRLRCPAHGFRRPQPDADLPGGDLRPRALGHDLRGRGRGAVDRQRHALWAWRRRLDPRRQPRLPLWAAIQAGRVWTNCYHLYPAHAAFGGYKQSGIGRENHKMMLDHYQQTKNMLVSYSPKALGFF